MTLLRRLLSIALLATVSFAFSACASCHAAKKTTCCGTSSCSK